MKGLQEIGNLINMLERHEVELVKLLKRLNAGQYKNGNDYTVKGVKNIKNGIEVFDDVIITWKNIKLTINLKQKAYEIPT